MFSIAICRQSNFVSNDFWSAFVDNDVFDCRLSGVKMKPYTSEPAHTNPHWPLINMDEKAIIGGYLVKESYNWRLSRKRILVQIAVCLLFCYRSKFEPWHKISNDVVCATSKCSDQPAHTRSLIIAFASRLSILWMFSYWMNSIKSF